MIDRLAIALHQWWFEVRLFIPLVPQGIEHTDGELVLRYPVSNEVKSSTIRYPSVAAALKDLQSKPEVQFRDEHGWTIAEDSSHHTFWSFPPAGHPAYPTAVQRAEIHPELTPQPGDVVVTKQRVSAFTGTNLDMVLRANNIDMLLLTGILTQGVVLSTLCHAADMDYRAVVVADGCSDRDPEVQRLLMEKIFPFQAMVTTVEECIGAIA